MLDKFLMFSEIECDLEKFDEIIIRSSAISSVEFYENYAAISMNNGSKYSIELTNEGRKYLFNHIDIAHSL